MIEPSYSRIFMMNHRAGSHVFFFAFAVGKRVVLMIVIRDAKRACSHGCSLFAVKSSLAFGLLDLLGFHQ